MTVRFELGCDLDLAVEYFVQQHGVARPDIFLQSLTDENTAGTLASGEDAFHEEGDRSDGPLEGEIELTADISSNQLPNV